ncbi:hypothetical protein F4811DRAFT_477280 [Daldinia bambusicola]|nr:hypothetical protein F4811DRAFT_477280 [Daldinia bambusicola]
MHRSAVEFLYRNFEVLKTYLGQIDMVDGTCQSYLAFIKSAGTDEMFHYSRTRWA